MKNQYRSLALALALALVGGGLASAQDAQPVSSVTGYKPQGESRIEVGLAFAQVLGSSSFSGTQTIRDYAEDGTFKSSYDVGGAPGGAFDLQYNLNDKFGVKAGAEFFSRASTGTFEAVVPHPFFFSRPRTATGTEEDLGFSESAYSLTAVYRGGSGKWRWSVEGGPALFNVKASLADRMTLAESYPYDTLAYGGVATSEKSTSPFGFAVGLEVGRQVTNSVAVVVQGRFTQGKSDIDVNGQNLSITAGGGQVRVGLRLTLARK
jgi:hypothetical protein